MSELYTSPGLHEPDKSSSSKGSTTHDVTADSNSNPKKRKREMVSSEQQPVAVRPRRTTVPIERLSADGNKKKHRQAHMTMALAVCSRCWLLTRSRRKVQLNQSQNILGDPISNQQTVSGFWRLSMPTSGSREK